MSGIFEARRIRGLSTKVKSQTHLPDTCPICHQPVDGLGPLDLVFHVDCVLRQWGNWPGNEKLKEKLQKEERCQ